ncbi:hypothetical protein QFZ49_000487 [Streptomyces turgidiscabies]|uniref:Uncharacterized protein n=1 Tax=Streptomyces turgidiscabies TaxID=85558 RepID=A0ABU0RF10_9ACTN|nr:hypothetical protein [Streptomyces turgidiscabies]
MTVTAGLGDAPSPAVTIQPVRRSRTSAFSATGGLGAEPPAEAPTNTGPVR